MGKESNKIEKVIWKICTKCGVKKEKTNEYFPYQNKSLGTFHSICKECHCLYEIEHGKKYRKDNAEKLKKLRKENANEKRAYDKEYYQKNIERIKEYQKNNADKKRKYNKKYCKDNAEKIKEYRKEYQKNNVLKRKEYYINNIEKIKEYGKKYRKENTEKIKEHCQNNIEKTKAHSKNYRKNNKKKLKEQQQKYRNLFALFTTYEYRLTIEELPKEDRNGYLLVKCTYCGKYFKPTNLMVHNRIYALTNNCGEARLYCSIGCKDACPVYNQNKWPKGFKPATSREVEPLIRQMCLKRDDYICQKCEKTIDEVELHCHHIEGATQMPLLANDVDNTITLCKPCHIWVHQQDGCTNYDLRCDKGGLYRNTR